jgi:hypothetical protein
MKLLRSNQNRGTLILLPKFVFILFVLFCSKISTASDLSDAEATELGYGVSAINAALQNPAVPGAMQLVTDLGHDQRYYVMSIGWINAILPATRLHCAVAATAFQSDPTENLPNLTALT